MADYDGPTYNITTGTFLNDPTYPWTNHFVMQWTPLPSPGWAEASFGSGGGGPATPEGDPIYGYGWGLSG